MFFSGPDLSPGIPSLTPQLHVQPSQDHQDQHAGHQQHAGYVSPLTTLEAVYCMIVTHDIKKNPINCHINENFVNYE